MQKYYKICIYANIFVKKVEKLVYLNFLLYLCTLILELDEKI